MSTTPRPVWFNETSSHSPSSTDGSEGGTRQSTSGVYKGKGSRYRVRVRKGEGWWRREERRGRTTSRNEADPSPVDQEPFIHNRHVDSG